MRYGENTLCMRTQFYQLLLSKEAVNITTFPAAVICCIALGLYAEIASIHYVASQPYHAHVGIIDDQTLEAIMVCNIPVARIRRHISL